MFFKFFENLVDPYEDYVETDTPPKTLWPFLRAYLGPFKKVFWVATIMSIIVAVVEIGLIHYLGHLVDLLSGDPAEVWAQYRGEFIIAALFVLLIRPVLQALDVLVLNNAILPNFGTLIRWR